MFMMRSRFNQRVIHIIIVLMIVFNTFGASLSQVLSIPSLVFTGLPIIMLVCLSIYMNKSRLRIAREIEWYLVVAIGIFIVHLIKYLAGFSVRFGGAEIKYIIYFIAFVFTLSVINIDDWNAVEISFVGISIFLCLDALHCVGQVVSKGLRIYNVTNFTFLDKAYYTVILTITVIFMLSDLLINKGKVKLFRKIALLFCIVIFSLVNVVIVQSKLFIIALATMALAMALFSKGAIRRRIVLILCLAVFTAIVIFTFFSNIVPDYIYIFLNRYFGLFGNIIAKMQLFARLSSTYVHRSTIYKYALKVFLGNFIFGVGFGNYRIYASANSELLGDVFQTESSYLGILVEGGVIYFLAHMIFLADILIKLCKGIRKNKNDLYLMKMLFVAIAYIILNTGNDFYNATYWIVFAFIYRASEDKMEELKIRNRK